MKYRQHDGELTGGPFDGDLDAFRYVSTGAMINFKAINRLKHWRRIGGCRTTRGVRSFM